MTVATTNLEEAIRHSGEGWLIDWFSPKENAISHLRETIAAVNERARMRLGGNAPDLSESALVSLYNRFPSKVKGFFQVLGGTRSPEMLLMAWRIIQGMEVKEVSVAYHRQRDFLLRVVLESPYGDPEETYESDKIQDFALFRHIGIMEISALPVFDGFYALNLK
jgi:hypothetical protein